MQHYKGAFQHYKCSWLITYVYVQLQKQIVKLMLSNSDNLCYAILTSLNIFLAYYLSLCGLKFSGICTERMSKGMNTSQIGVIFSHQFIVWQTLHCILSTEGHLGTHIECIMMLFCNFFQKLLLHFCLCRIHIKMDGASTISELLSVSILSSGCSWFRFI